MLYIIRHAKTDWNELHRLQGRTDIPLNQTGIQMARDAGTEYREVHFDVWCGVVEVVYLDGVLLGGGLYEWGVELLADCGGVDCGGH